MDRDCKHGQLARSCEICELEAERDTLLDQNAALRKALEERRDTLERLVYLDPRESQRARLDEVREVLRLLSTPAPPEIERPAACPFWDGEHCCHATGRELERLRRIEAAARVINDKRRGFSEQPVKPLGDDSTDNTVQAAWGPWSRHDWNEFGAALAGGE